MTDRSLETVREPFDREEASSLPEFLKDPLTSIPTTSVYRGVWPSSVGTQAASASAPATANRNVRFM